MIEVQLLLHGGIWKDHQTTAATFCTLLLLLCEIRKLSHLYSQISAIFLIIAWSSQCWFFGFQLENGVICRIEVCISIPYELMIGFWHFLPLKIIKLRINKSHVKLFFLLKIHVSLWFPLILQIYFNSHSGGCDISIYVKALLYLSKWL